MKRAMLIAALVFGSATTARADPRYAIDRFVPSERGSEWFASDSLDFRGRVRPSFGYVLAFSHRSLVVPFSDGSERVPVRDLAFVHLGGSVVLSERLRLALDLPFQIYADGEGGASLPAPPEAGGIGNLRASGDVRLFGQYRGAITGAIGVQAWLPTGQQSQWASDGVFRARPHVMLAGEIHSFVWAAELGYFARSSSEITASAAAGYRVTRRLVVGPEIFASTALDDAFARTATPVEALLGAHWLVGGTARIGGALGAGLGSGIGAPAWRGIFSVEWAPERFGRGEPDDHHFGHLHPALPPPDRDHDGVPDDRDACPDVPGIATNHTKTNGCPPDTDGDTVDDLTDACPTVPGIVTSDPMTNGCPDRDRDHDDIPNDVDACPDQKGAPDIDPRKNGCPQAFVRAEKIETRDPITFKSGTGDLATDPENEAILTALLTVVLELPQTSRLRIEGHTDNRGDPASNRKLSNAKAASIAKWLADHGIDRARITSEGFGGDRPVDTNETEAGRAENRRVEILISLEGTRSRAPSSSPPLAPEGRERLVP